LKSYCNTRSGIDALSVQYEFGDATFGSCYAPRLTGPPMDVRPSIRRCSADSTWAISRSMIDEYIVQSWLLHEDQDRSH